MLRDRIAVADPGALTAVVTQPAWCPRQYRLPDPPRNGTESAASADGELEDFIHLHLLSGGVSLRPFRNMALRSPVTTTADVDLHHAIVGAAMGELLGD
jgi:glutamate-1-semialdehyde 2,1-aminomutase